MIVMFSSSIWLAATLLDDDYVPQRRWSWDELIRDENFNIYLLGDAVCDTSFCGDLGNYLWQDSEHGKKHRHFRYRLREDGSISPYDSLFRIYADSVNWDWRMLAAVAYNESKFKTHLTSKKGASGVMQLMPVTAVNFGCPADSLHIPEFNIRAGAYLLKHLERRLRRHILLSSDSLLVSPLEADSALMAQVDEELIWYTLAAYNAGLGHVYDAIALAETLGYDPASWHSNVESCLKLKNDTTYANLDCVRLGKFNARVTLQYVQDVLDTYKEFKRVKKK